MAVKRNNSLETRSIILKTKKYLCATIAIGDDILSKRVDPRLPIRKIEQRNTAKTAITVLKARTIEKIESQNATIRTMALTTKDRTGREKTTMNTA
jgi:hypothetical protein